MPDVDADMDVDVVAVSPPPAFNEKKYFCQRCLNHGKHFPRKGHKPLCQHAHCTCSNCSMVETRRQLNNKLSKKKPQAAGKQTSDGRKVRDPQCARCSAHGVMTPLRGHKKSMCAYSDCECEMCKLVVTRRNVMARQIKLRRDQQRARISLDGRQSIDSSESTCSDTTETTPSPAPPLIQPLAVRPIPTFMPSPHQLLPSIHPAPDQMMQYQQQLQLALLLTMLPNVQP